VAVVLTLSVTTLTLICKNGSLMIRSLVLSLIELLGEIDFSSSPLINIHVRPCYRNLGQELVLLFNPLSDKAGCFA
jgi:hypothetical protein